MKRGVESYTLHIGRKERKTTQHGSKDMQAAASNRTYLKISMMKIYLDVKYGTCKDMNVGWA